MTARPPCPRCGKPMMRWSANHKGGKPRWACQTGHSSGNPGTFCTITTDPYAGVRGRDGRARKQPIYRRRKGSTQVFVVTCAQNATPRHKLFYAALEQYCNHRNAQLFVIPTRYKNPTSRWSQSQENEDVWDIPEAHLLNTRVRLNRNIEVLGDIKTQPTASSPLTGFEAITAGESGILGHTKLQLRTVAAPQGRLPKILTTTGACTVSNYTDSKAGKLGEFHHTLGACVVEVSGATFHLRQINADKRTGEFQELETVFGGDKPRRGPRPLGLVMGDTHERAIDRAVAKATFGEIVPLLDPEALVWHDLADGETFNHHLDHNPFAPIRREADDAVSVRQEVWDAFEFVAKHGAGRRNIIVPSNHNDWLQRWINENDWRKIHPKNRLFYLQTAQVLAAQASLKEGDVERMDAFTFWAKQRFAQDRNVTVLNYDESCMLGNIEVGMHGHLGPNGSRGTLKTLGRIGVRTVTGHAHSPGIEEGAYRVGTSSRLRLGYNKGPSSWLHTHCLIYANSKRTLLNIIDGEWRI